MTPSTRGQAMPAPGVDRTKLARAEGMTVNVGGRALCSTGNSRWLDDRGDGYKYYEGRDDAALRIALCWNACRHLTDEQLVAMVSSEHKEPATPPPTQSAP